MYCLYQEGKDPYEVLMDLFTDLVRRVKSEYEHSRSCFGVMLHYIPTYLAELLQLK